MSDDANSGQAGKSVGVVAAIVLAIGGFFGKLLMRGGDDVARVVATSADDFARVGNRVGSQAGNFGDDLARAAPRGYDPSLVDDVTHLPSGSNYTNRNHTHFHVSPHLHPTFENRQANKGQPWPANIVAGLLREQRLRQLRELTPNRSYEELLALDSAARSIHFLNRIRDRERKVAPTLGDVPLGPDILSPTDADADMPRMTLDADEAQTVWNIRGTLPTAAVIATLDERHALVTKALAERLRELRSPTLVNPNLAEARETAIQYLSAARQNEPMTANGLKGRNFRPVLDFKPRDEAAWLRDLIAEAQSPNTFHQAVTKKALAANLAPTDPDNPFFDSIAADFIRTADAAGKITVAASDITPEVKRLIYCRIPAETSDGSAEFAAAMSSPQKPSGDLNRSVFVQINWLREIAVLQQIRLRLLFAAHALSPTDAD